MKRLQLIAVALMVIMVIAGLIINFVLAQQAQQTANSQGSYTKPVVISCDEHVLPKSADQKTEAQVDFLVSSRDQSETIYIWHADKLIYACTNFDTEMLTGEANSSFSLPILKSGEPFKIAIGSSDQVWERDIVPNNPQDWGLYNGELPEEFIVFVWVNDKGRLIVRQDHESPMYE